MKEEENEIKPITMSKSDSIIYDKTLLKNGERSFEQTDLIASTSDGTVPVDNRTPVACSWTNYTTGYSGCTVGIYAEPTGKMAEMHFDQSNIVELLRKGCYLMAMTETLAAAKKFGSTCALRHILDEWMNGDKLMQKFALTTIAKIIETRGISGIDFSLEERLLNNIVIIFRDFEDIVSMEQFFTILKAFRRDFYFDYLHVCDILFQRLKKSQNDHLQSKNRRNISETLVSELTVENVHLKKTVDDLTKTGKTKEDELASLKLKMENQKFEMENLDAKNDQLSKSELEWKMKYDIQKSRNDHQNHEIGDLKKEIEKRDQKETEHKKWREQYENNSQLHLRSLNEDFKKKIHLQREIGGLKLNVEKSDWARRFDEKEKELKKEQEKCAEKEKELIKLTKKANAQQKKAEKGKKIADDAKAKILTLKAESKKADKERQKISKILTALRNKLEKSRVKSMDKDDRIGQLETDLMDAKSKIEIQQQEKATLKNVSETTRVKLEELQQELDGSMVQISDLTKKSQDANEQYQTIQRTLTEENHTFQHDVQKLKTDLDQAKRMWTFFRDVNVSMLRVAQESKGMANEMVGALDESIRELIRPWMECFLNNLEKKLENVHNSAFQNRI